MPKMKTHKGTAKRFRITKTGKLMHMKTGRTHLRRRKSASKKSDFRHAVSTPATGLRKRVQKLAGPAVSD
jgi:large subunit ribosomal protein L35